MMQKAKKVPSPFEDFGEADLEECYERIQNPVGKPLLIISTRLGLYRPNRSVSVENKHLHFDHV